VDAQLDGFIDQQAKGYAAWRIATNQQLGWNVGMLENSPEMLKKLRRRLLVNVA